jgi:hypothetical protein
VLYSRPGGQPGPERGAGGTVDKLAP